MKLIFCLVGLGGLLAISGCESPEHEWREHHRGGVYDNRYHGYGRGSYDYDRGYRYDNDRYWERRDYRYRY